MAWSLWKVKFFLLGARNLYVAMDHKPLLGLYRPDHQLSEVENPRLVNLVEKMSRFCFTAFHIHGEKLRQLKLYRGSLWERRVSLR